MIGIIRPALNALLRHSYIRFKEQLGDPGRAQRVLLKELVRNLAATEYGRSLGVREGDDYDAFSRRTPIAGYDELKPWIESQKSHERHSIVSEPVLFYEKTSGSSGPVKYIPYTSGLKGSFNRMFSVWLHDLLEHGPRFETGRLFISVSPAFGDAQATKRGIKVGLDDDADYLNSWMRWLSKRFLVAPASIKKLREPGDFKHVLAALLLAEPGLEVISIWNPSLLEVILDYIQASADALIDDLKSGLIARGNLEFRFRRQPPERLAILKDQPIDWARTWPKLKLISCWTSAHASSISRRLARQFPGVRVQGKGLLATEAPLTLPLIEARGFVPLPGEVFYEFLDDRENISLLHELETGCEYEIVLTQKGGLYRYRIGDRVRVTHSYKSTPCLEFIGRNDEVCDLVGEKLNESFARECLSTLQLESSRFQTLLPVMPERGRCHYVLILDELPGCGTSIEERLDEALCDAHHYRNARRLGQLDPARVRVAPHVREAYNEYFMMKGMKWGGIKHQYIVRRLDDAANLMAILTDSGQLLNSAHSKAE